MSIKWKRILLGMEYALLFFGIPLFMFLDTGFILPSTLLLPVLVVVILILRFGTGFKWNELIYLRIYRKGLVKDGVILLICGACLVLYVLILFPDKLFNLPRANPLIWLALVAFYPVFSAYPQEILFRTYIFRRYRIVFTRDWQMIAASGFTRDWQMIAASGLSFSFVHILYYHPISLILTLIGGIYLAAVYNRTRSVLYSAILHAIMGMLVFSVGLGEFFWIEMYEYF